MSMTRLLTVVATLLLAAPLGAQPVATVRGAVVDINGKPVKGAQVKAGSAAVTATDAGIFTLKLKPGTYDVTATLKGYTTDTQKVTVKANETKDISAVLMKQ